jgi:restriction system protein
MAQPMYQVTVENVYLGESKSFSGRSPLDVQTKANAQLAKWAEKEASLRRVAALEKDCAAKNSAARAEIAACNSILATSISGSPGVDWETVYDRRPYADCVLPAKPCYEVVAERMGVRKKRTVVEFFSKARASERESQEGAARAQLDVETTQWEAECASVRAQHEIDMALWLEKQAEWNHWVDSVRDDLRQGGAQAVEFYAGKLFEGRLIPGLEESTVEVSMEEATGTLGMNVELPGPGSMPRFAEYRFVKTKLEIVPVEMKPKERDSLYESVVFQTALAMMADVFRAPEAPSIQSVVFNGWVHGVDRSTGKDFTSCIISVRAMREQFDEIQLDRVDPKQCVRNLKGMFAPTLVSLAPVRPFMELNRTDQRFVASREVLEGLDQGKNLALMDWEDFEHLVRELFERVFCVDGGEVRVTQASRDQGVDAIAFDPDPIRGGKFVIQAKRYNNLVPVSAVRDLYGTMLNEGATKGILVTTAYYGPDAYDFAKDKPLTLIDGSELLGMLDQYGHGGFNITLVKGGPDGKANVGT